ncbi:type II toxin-antitoxin system VapC family toxin [Nisaea sp.]|uniref:type II toxin-antitoxin system VapC family toxin n=1 Tax=Nisaea sp. TaxID=2024842 RepID=UPI003B52D0D4
MVVFDATILIALLHPNGRPPRCRGTNLPVDGFEDRIDFLIETLERQREKIIIPAPVLSEILVHADRAGTGYLHELSNAAVFRPVPFDERAAVEVAAMARMRRESGGLPRRDGQTFAKLKYDRQIVATAIVERASAIYSDDGDIKALGDRHGIPVIRIEDLPLPPVPPQMEISFHENAGSITDERDDKED